MTPEGQKAVQELIAKWRSTRVVLDRASRNPRNGELENARMDEGSQTLGLCADELESLLALLLVEAHQNKRLCVDCGKPTGDDRYDICEACEAASPEIFKADDTRVDHLQCGAPLATASENQTIPTRFRKKPVVIEARQYAGGGNMKPRGGLQDWLWQALKDGTVHFSRGGDPLIIETLEGPLTVSPGDWIIQGIKGELYPCKPDIFAELYELEAPAPVTPTRHLQGQDTKEDQARGRTGRRLDTTGSSAQKSES